MEIKKNNIVIREEEISIKQSNLYISILTPPTNTILPLLSIPTFIISKPISINPTIHTQPIYTTYTTLKEVVKAVEDGILTLSESLGKKSSSQFPLILNVHNRIYNTDKISVPMGTYKVLKEKVPAKLLFKVHADKQVAIETCLLFVSQFTKTIIDYLRGDEYHISMWSKILIENYGKNYKRIIDVLIYGGILVCDNRFIRGSKSYNYRLGDKFLTKTTNKFKITTKQVKVFRGKMIAAALARATDNVIARNSLWVCSMVDLPDIAYLKKVGRAMVKAKKVTKRRRLYKIRGNTKRELNNKVRYIEDDIQLFDLLTLPSYYIPTPSDNAGGRITDSFTLMPSWIRNEITIKGEKLMESDFSALHPNILSGKYGDGTQITHEYVALKLELEDSVLLVKKEHLSFFNKPVYGFTYEKNGKNRYMPGMKDSPLWDYYNRYQPRMLEKVCVDKIDFGYKYTCNVLFTIEVEMMTRAILILNSEAINPMYVYDALYGLKRDINRIQEVMQFVANEFQIPTEAKIK